MEEDNKEWQGDTKENSAQLKRYIREVDGASSGEREVGVSAGCSEWKREWEGVQKGGNKDKL